MVDIFLERGAVAAVTDDEVANRLALAVMLTEPHHKALRHDYRLDASAYANWVGTSEITETATLSAEFMERVLREMKRPDCPLFRCEDWNMRQTLVPVAGPDPLQDFYGVPPRRLSRALRRAFDQAVEDLLLYGHAEVVEWDGHLVVRDPRYVARIYDLGQAKPPPKLRGVHALEARVDEGGENHGSCAASGSPPKFIQKRQLRLDGRRR